MTVVSHNPGECKKTLARTVSPVVVDLETTGLHRCHQIVSAGLLIDGIAHILFARSRHVSVRNNPLPVFYDALQPLERPDLVVVGHNATFDLGFLRREGIVVQGEVRDTMKLLRLIDQDRGHEGGQDRHKPRIDRRAPSGPEALNYKLKPAVAQLLGIHMPHFPGQIDLAPYDIHARYLTCDLVGTWNLYTYLWTRLSATERQYYQTLVGPLIHLLVEMTDNGVSADLEFAHAEADRLEKLMEQLDAEHQRTFRLRLEHLKYQQLADWLYTKLALPVLKRKRFGRKFSPALDSDTLKTLASFTDDAKTQSSLLTIRLYREAASLLVRLRTLTKHVAHDTGKVYSKFDDTQATGRVSSTYPNIQQIAKKKTVAGEEFLSRNFLRASPGYEFAVFDIAQADIRVLAHMVESFNRTTEEHQRQLRRERHALVKSAIKVYDRRDELKNPDFTGHPQERPDFSPTMPADLAADFATTADFYSSAAQRILNRAPKDKTERNRFKNVILSIVNGQGPKSLAKSLDSTKDEAQEYLRLFEIAYPKVAAYKQLMHWQIAYTGQTHTFMGRPRTVTAHRWMVSEPQVEIMVSFHNGEVCWLDVVPLEPTFRVLTTYVRRAWNARTGKLIYDHQRGRLSGKWYHLFDEGHGQYLLPIRNWAWRNIRRVRCKGEEAGYEGFEATARSAFNFICQGGTADVCKLMMLRSREVCRQFGARLLDQIHDELVFEVPKDNANAFFTAMMIVLQEPPTPDFKVPIKVEAKRGERFGELQEWKPV